jgi:hypothetical protein
MKMIQYGILISCLVLFSCNGMEVSSEALDELTLDEQLLVAVAEHKKNRSVKQDIIRLINDGANVNFHATREIPLLYFGKVIGVTPLQIAAESDDVPLIEMLVERGANVQSECRSGEKRTWTPLRGAIIKNQYSAAHKLLDCKASPNEFDNLETMSMTPYPLGETPLMDAIDFCQGSKKRLALVKRLVACRADVNASTIKGESCLYKATYKEINDVACFLLANGANVNGATVYYRPLVNLVSIGNVDLVIRFLDYNPDIMKQGSLYGDTVLHHAVCSITPNRLMICGLLLTRPRFDPEPPQNNEWEQFLTKSPPEISEVVKHVPMAMLKSLIKDKRITLHGVAEALFYRRKQKFAELKELRDKDGKRAEDYIAAHAELEKSLFSSDQVQARIDSIIKKLIWMELTNSKKKKPLLL